MVSSCSLGYCCDDDTANFALATMTTHLRRLLKNGRKSLRFCYIKVLLTLSQEDFVTRILLYDLYSLSSRVIVVTMTPGKLCSSNNDNTSEAASKEWQKIASFCYVKVTLTLSWEDFVTIILLYDLW